MNKSTMYKLSYGLFILTAQENGKDNGCIINTAIQVTSSPNRISIAVNKDNYTHDMILNTSRFTVSILSQDASFELFKHFGFQSGKTTDKFENFSACRRSSNGTMIVEDGTNAWISANVVSTVDLGTHTQFFSNHLLLFPEQIIFLILIHIFLYFFSNFVADVTALGFFNENSHEHL